MVRALRPNGQRSIGEFPLTISRDRNGEFEPLIIKKNQTSLTGLEDQIIAMYAKGLSTRDIEDYFNHLYGATVSPTLISTVTNKILPLLKEWQNRSFFRRDFYNSFF